MARAVSVRAFDVTRYAFRPLRNEHDRMKSLFKNKVEPIRHEV